MQIFFFVIQHRRKACELPFARVYRWEYGVSLIGFENLSDVKSIAMRQDLLIERSSAYAKKTLPL